MASHGKRGRKPGSQGELERLLMDAQVRSWRTLTKAFHAVYRPLERELLREGCSVPRFQVLFHLYFSGPLAATQLAKELFVTRGNISTFLKRLQAEDYIAVSDASPSTKRPLFCLTPRGKKFFEGLFPRHIGRVKAIMPTLKSAVLLELERIATRPESSVDDVYI